MIFLLKYYVAVKYTYNVWQIEKNSRIWNCKGVVQKSDKNKAGG